MIHLLLLHRLFTPLHSDIAWAQAILAGLGAGKNINPSVLGLRSGCGGIENGGRRLGIRVLCVLRFLLREGRRPMKGHK